MRGERAPTDYTNVTSSTQIERLLADPKRMWKGAPKPLLALLGAYLATYAGWQLFGWGGSGPKKVIGDLAFLPAYAAATVMAAKASRRCAAVPRLRSSWRLIAIGLGFYTLGIVLQSCYEIAGGSTPYPSLADPAYLMFYPFALAGLLRFPHRGQSRSQRRRTLIDCATVAFAGGAVIWYVVLGPTTLVEGASWLQMLVSVAGPVGDLMLIVGLATVLLRRTLPASETAMRVLAAGLVLFVAADLVYGWASLHSAYSGGDPVDTLYMVALSLFLVGAAAQRTPIAVDNLAGATTIAQLTWLPWLGVALAFALLGLAERHEAFVPAGGLFISVVAVVALAAVRQLFAQRELLSTHRELDALLRALPDGMGVVDADGRITMANKRMCEMTGFSVEELVGSGERPPFWPEEQNDQLLEARRAAITGDDGHFEVVYRRKNGERFPATVTTSRLGKADGGACAFLAVVRDVTREVREREQLREAHDNQRAITSSMGQGLYTIDRAGRLLYVNPAAEEMLGWCHHELVGQVMHDVVHFLRADGTPLAAADCPLFDVGRHGTVVRTADEVFVRKDRSVFPVEVTAAPYNAEDGLRGYVVVFSDITERKAEERRMREQIEKVSWLRRVRDALAEKRFVLYAQPIIDLASGETVQHELLIRMLGPNGEVIAPGRFLPVAEEYGLITDIDRWVIQQAAEIAAQGHRVELNLSAHSIGTARLIDKVEDVLRRTGADPALITIELTETAVVADAQAAEEFIRRLNAVGCKFALDDFGTGYASFTYIKHLPVDYLKIDTEFVRDVVDNEASRHVVNAVVSLARDFGQQTIAEGVEDGRSMHVLRNLGVDYAQGYAIARPRPVSEVFALAGSPLSAPA